MFRRVTLADYLGSEETNRPRELTYGRLREPAAPTVSHQLIVGRVYDCLNRHVRRRQAGVVVVSPVDVILDRERDLVVQPDVVFVRTERLDICTDRIWGPPDLVVEVMSIGSSRHDRTAKLGWYRTYGVSESWLVDGIARTVTVVDLTAQTHASRTFEHGEIVRSRVLPRVRLKASRLFNEERV